MYSLTDVNGKENKRGKGVKSVVVENIKHKKHRDALFNKKIMRHIMKRIQSNLRKIGTYKVCKISLSFLMIRDICEMMVLIVQLIFIRIQGVNNDLFKQQYSQNSFVIVKFSIVLATFFDIFVSAFIVFISPILALFLCLNHTIHILFLFFYLIPFLVLSLC